MRHARPSFCWSARRHLRHCSQRTSTTPGHAVMLSEAAVLLMWRCWWSWVCRTPWRDWKRCFVKRKIEMLLLFCGVCSLPVSIVCGPSLANYCHVSRFSHLVSPSWVCLQKHCLRISLRPRQRHQGYGGMEGSLQQQLLLVFELGTKKEQAPTDLLHRTVWDHGHGQTQMSCNFQTFSFSKLTTTTTTNKQNGKKRTLKMPVWA